jgi:hypothetical protein
MVFMNWCVIGGYFVSQKLLDHLQFLVNGHCKKTKIVFNMEAVFEV